MLGKNNFKARAEQEATKVKRYAIKKFSVGVASVAVATGLLFASNAALVSAETLDSQTGETTSTTEAPAEEAAEEWQLKKQ